MRQGDFTEGKIFGPLLQFVFPVLLALFLQSLYGAVDLLVVGQFSTSAEVSAVSTGAQVMQLITNTIASLSMGTTVLLGQEIGRGERNKAGKTVGASIVFFLILAVALTGVMLLNIHGIASIMNAPEEAFESTCDYIRICSCGMIFIIGYNLIGSLFRGLGNSRLPLITVAIAAVLNIFGDIFLVHNMHLGAAGAAYATVFSQAVSVVISYLIIRKMDLPFAFGKSMIHWDGALIKQIVGIGFPIALADMLVGITFLVIAAIVNALGVTISAGVGVAEKVSSFIMLVPSAFSQSMAAFTAQNYGAGKMDRAIKGLKYGILVSFGIGVAMSWLSFFHGDLLCSIFSRDADAIAAGWEYLKAYAIDCLLTPIFFNMIGFYNGCGHTKFVMAENMIGALGCRVPVSYAMSKVQPVSVFRIGLGTPASSLLQTILCVLYFFHFRKKELQKAS